MKPSLIIKDGREAAYLQVARQLRSRLGEGKLLREDGRLPSFRQLSAEYGVSICVIQQAMRLLRENWDWHKPLRSIGVRATDLLPASTPVQCSIFEDSERQEKRERLERSVDDLRRRFGHYCVGRAVCVSDPTLRNISPKEEHVIHPVGYFKAV